MELEAELSAQNLHPFPNEQLYSVVSLSRITSQGLKGSLG